MLLHTFIIFRRIVRLALVPTSQWAKVRPDESLKFVGSLYFIGYIL